MRLVPSAMTTAWRAEHKTPVVRATISRFRLKRFPYDTAWRAGSPDDMDWASQKEREGTFTSALFGGDMDVREIKNLKSCSWSRSTDQDVAECTLTLLNSELTPIGNQERTEHASDFDMPGFFSYNRGYPVGGLSNTRWGYGETGWENIFIPDRLVKTYEGYASDESLPPGLDPNLVQSGTWLVDKVTYSRSGDIILSMRDIGKLLLDQICFPPVIPYPEYPIEWSHLRSEQVLGREPVGGTWSAAILDEGQATSSNTYYTDDWAGVEDPGTDQPYVGSGGAVWGHQPRDAVVNTIPEVQAAFAADPPESTPYWLSTGQSTRRSKVWWQFDFDDPRSIAALRLMVVGGPYRVYISVKGADGEWRGRRRINYTVTTKDVDIEAKHRFVKTAIADRGRPFDVNLNRVHHGVTSVRITFARLWDTQTSEEFPWRAGLRVVQIYRNTTGDPAGDNLAYEQGTHLASVGNYRDYTDIVKWACCWGGFYWPAHGQDDASGTSAEDYVRLGWVGPTGGMVNLKRWVTWETYDPRLPTGRAWGDFMDSGTHGLNSADLTQDLFDKQPLMDMIAHVRDVLGFLFFIDEQGGAIFRMPNIFKKGNYLSPVTFGAHTRARTAQYVTIDENVELLDYHVDIDGESNREVIFVANLQGDFGSAIEGYAPADARMRRTAGWTDQNFKDAKEARRMADMIATQQMFNYRRGKVTIHGYPAIQIDDQVRIFERVTNETFFHYVLGIEANWTADGEYTYTLDTHWLGEDENTWALDTTRLNGLTQTYLNELGIEDTDNGVGAGSEDGGA